jgi:hypothetical protein
MARPSHDTMNQSLSKQGTHNNILVDFDLRETSQLDTILLYLCSLCDVMCLSFHSHFNLDHFCPIVVIHKEFIG